MASERVVIIGAGIIGLCSALYAARQGLKVTVLDRNPQRRDGCSFGNAGMVVPSHFTPLAAPGVVWQGIKWMRDPQSPFYIKPRIDTDLFRWAWRFWRASSGRRARAAEPFLRDFALLSRRCYEEIGLREDSGLVKRGLLMLCRTGHALDEEAQTAERARALGLAADVLDARQTAALDPDITMNVRGAVHYPADCHLDPGRFMAALEHELDSLGVERVWEAEAEGFETDDRTLRAVRAGAATFECEQVVLAGGVWSDRLARGLDLRLPMQAGKGYSLTLEQPRQLPQLCSICTEARIAVTPMNGRLRFGGTMEMAGIDETITAARVRGIIRSVPDYFPAFEKKDFEGVEPWHGLRPVPPDGLPYLGRSARWRNLVVATGHAMMGLSLAPATGLIVSQILAKQEPALPLDLCAVDR